MNSPAPTVPWSEYGPVEKSTPLSDRDTVNSWTDMLRPEISRLSALPPEAKRSVVYALLRDLLGDRLQQETDICDPDGFLYMSLIPPGLREYFRLLEHPEREEQLRNASKEPTFTLQQIREEMELI